MDENELIKKAITDREAFGQIVDIYYKEVLGYIYKRTFDKELSNDLAQETFLRALKYLRSYRGKSPFVFWLLRIATNVINNHYRKEIRKNNFLNTIKSFYYEKENNPEDQIDPEFVRRCISKLSLNEQAVITLTFFEHKSIKDTAFVIGKTVSATRRLYYRSLNDLRKIMEKM